MGKIVCRVVLISANTKRFRGRHPSRRRHAGLLLFAVTEWPCVSAGWRPPRNRRLYTVFFYRSLFIWKGQKRRSQMAICQQKKKLLMRPYTAILPVLTYGSMHCEANRLGVCWYEQKGGLETSLSVWWRVWHKLNGSINYRLRKLKACFDIHALRGRSLSPSSSHPIADDNVEPAGRAIVAKKWRKDYRLLFVKWCFYLKTAIVRFCFTDF